MAGGAAGRAPPRRGGRRLRSEARADRSRLTSRATYLGSYCETYPSLLSGHKRNSANGLGGPEGTTSSSVTTPQGRVMAVDKVTDGPR
jgi:hypothetical protein